MLNFQRQRHEKDGLKQSWPRLKTVCGIGSGANTSRIVASDRLGKATIDRPQMRSAVVGRANCGLNAVKGARCWCAFFFL